ncbi:hypothetical protein NDU88_008794 [Pleurodeles waltl]|uniref:Uncharacterized protein n=1 Tax=Pleurodeles waltl TaxID=8319 RepID=A0AAV7RUT2_PLEWA|nr:hypothetical protein NDU88_008794 [Pleurodeles waltl]
MAGRRAVLGTTRNTPRAWPPRATLLEEGAARRNVRGAPSLVCLPAIKKACGGKGTQAAAGRQQFQEAAAVERPEGPGEGLEREDNVGSMPLAVPRVGTAGVGPGSGKASGFGGRGPGEGQEAPGTQGPYFQKMAQHATVEQQRGGRGAGDRGGWVVGG